MRSPPPLNALRAFEAAARHLSFKDAARELNVTPAAVSHQVKALETWLGAALFIRMSRALRLTDIGQNALPILSDGFQSLGAAVKLMETQRNSALLTISVSPSFGSIWLVPKLDSFRARHPEIEIRLDGTDRLVDIANGDADVAIRYGPGRYGGVRVDTLFGQVNTPVCSPALLSGDKPLRHPRDLRHHTLLHVQWKDAEASWRMWLLAAGARDVDDTTGLRFSEESMAVQAALNGQGVALIGDKLVADYIADGQLIRPFDPALHTPLTFAYHLLSTRHLPAPPKVVAFRTWLLQEAATAVSQAKNL